MKNKTLAALLLLFVPSVSLGAAGQGVSTWPAMTEPVADEDLVAGTDVSDTSGSDDGTSKKITAAQLKTYMDIPTVSDVAYDATSWNGNTDAATKNAIRDKFESLGTGGDVVGPTSSTDNYLVVFDGTTGKLLQEISCYIDTTSNNELVCPGFQAIRTTTAQAIDIYEGTGDGDNKLTIQGGALASDVSISVAELSLLDGKSNALLDTGSTLNGDNITTGTVADARIASTIARDSELPSKYSGTATLGTSEIADGSCATVVTVSATGIITTDTINLGYNSTPIGKTGYDPTAGAELSIRAYPTADNVNVLVCNRTGAAVTPSAMTINWSVIR